MIFIEKKIGGQFFEVTESIANAVAFAQQIRETVAFATAIGTVLPYQKKRTPVVSLYTAAGEAVSFGLGAATLTAKENCSILQIRVVAAEATRKTEYATHGSIRGEEIAFSSPLKVGETWETKEHWSETIDVPMVCSDGGRQAFEDTPETYELNQLRASANTALLMGQLKKEALAKVSIR